MTFYLAFVFSAIAVIFGVCGLFIIPVQQGLMQSSFLAVAFLSACISAILFEESAKDYQ